MRRALLLSLLLVPCVALAQSPPNPSQGMAGVKLVSHTDISGERAEKDQRGTYDHPFVTEIVRSEADKERKDQEATDQRVKTGLDKRVAHWTKILGIATIILAVGTVALAVFTLRLVLDAKNTASRQLRAYVSVRVDTIGPAGKDAPLPFTVFIRNHGVTPAYDVHVKTGTAYAPRNFKIIPADDGSEIDSMSDLHTGDPMYSVQETAFILTEEHKTALTSGNQRIFIFGTVHYKDTFGRPYYSNFSYRIGGPELARAFASKESATNSMFERTKEHNDCT